jgi:hypothetical protein
MKPERPNITKADRRRLAKLDRQLSALEFNAKSYCMLDWKPQYDKCMAMIQKLDMKRMRLRNWMKYGGDKP